MNNLIKLILVLLLILLILNELQKKELFTSNKNISLVIPCIPRDIEKLNRLFESIKKQSYQPYEIIIAISECNFNKAQELKSKLKKLYDYEVIILETLEKQGPGENRNRGAVVAKGDVVSFFDADDAMYHNRLEVINKYFNLYNPKVLVHSYSFGYEHYKKTDQEKVIFGNELYDDLIRRDGKIDNSDMHHTLWYLNGDVHNGHSSIQKDVINDIKFTSHKAGEDGLFLRNIISKYGRKDNTIIFVKIPLTQYIPSIEQ